MMNRVAVAVVTLLLVLANVGAVRAAGASTTQRISGKTLEALAAKAVAGVKVGPNAQIVAAYNVPDQIVQAGNASLTVGAPAVSPTYVNVPIEVDVDGRYARIINVGYRVETFVTTAVATHDLVAGTVLGAGDVKMSRIVFYGQRPNGTDVLVGRKIMSPVRTGAPIYIEMTQTNQIVRAGNTVVLIVHDGGVSIAADVIARTSGGLGDSVSLYNPQTNKALSGIVVGPDRVELDLTGDTP